MDITPVGTASMGPPGSISPNGVANLSLGNGVSTPGGSPAQALAVSAAVQQPKVVQTAFIHKLYK